MNRWAQEYRDAGLKILNPTQNQIEHGFELHKNSVVCDSYGFAPISPIDGDAVKEAIEKGASPGEIKDMKEEMMMTRYVKDPTLNKEFREYFDASGVTCIFQNAGEEGPLLQTMIRRMAHFTFVCDTMKDFVEKAVHPDDFINAKKQHRHCLYFSANGVPLAQQWHSIEGELQFIKILFELGCRMMHLTYNRRNMIGDGCSESTNAGLSDLGKAVVKEMNRVGIIVDVAHSGWQTCIDSAKVSTHPIVASHTACFPLSRHYRNKPDDVIKAIVDTDGYIGICCIPVFLGRTGDITALLDHIDYVARKFGVDHVAIGTDVHFTSQYAEIEEKKVPKLPLQKTQYEYFWPQNPYAQKADSTHAEYIPYYGGGYLGAPENANYTRRDQNNSLAWTNWPLFTVGLVQRGYSDEDIKKIIGGNATRVARKVIDGDNKGGIFK